MPRKQGTKGKGKGRIKTKRKTKRKSVAGDNNSKKGKSKGALITGLAALGLGVGGVAMYKRVKKNINNKILQKNIAKVLKFIENMHDVKWVNEGDYENYNNAITTSKFIYNPNIPLDNAIINFICNFALNYPHEIPPTFTLVIPTDRVFYKQPWIVDLKVSLSDYMKSIRS
jgi:hypothetical protein